MKYCTDKQATIHSLKSLENAQVTNYDLTSTKQWYLMPSNGGELRLC
jgi:hypothetical protein